MDSLIFFCFSSFSYRRLFIFTAVLLSLRPGLGLEDPRGQLMKVLALALALGPQVLALPTAKAKAKTFPPSSDKMLSYRRETALQGVL